MFQELVCHLCKGKIDGSLLDGRMLGRHKVLGIRLVLSSLQIQTEISFHGSMPSPIHLKFKLLR